MRHQGCELATREATAFRSAAMLNIYEVKVGSVFVTSSDKKVSGFDRPHDSKLLVDLNLSTLDSGFKKS